MQDDIDRRHGTYDPLSAPGRVMETAQSGPLNPIEPLTGANQPDTAPSELEIPDCDLKPCGCDPSIDQTCAICYRAHVQPDSSFANRELDCKSDTERRNIHHGGDHRDAGKPRLDLLDPYAMEQMGHVLAFGAGKYGDPFNYTKGIAYLRLTGSALRHIFAFIRGEDTDPESGYPHLAHGMCCLMMLLSMTQRHPELDDRCKTEAA